MDTSFGGRSVANDAREIMRLLLAACISHGSSFRASIIEAARNPVLAPPIEVGLDKELIVKHCHAIEKIETKYQLLFTLILIAAVVLRLGSEESITAGIGVYEIVAIVFAMVVSIIRQAAYKKMLRRFRLDDFETVQLPTVQLDKEDVRGIGRQSQNVCLYRGYSPFDFAGVNFGDWALSIDVERRSSVAGKEDRGTVSSSELEELIILAILRDNPNTRYRPILTVQGCDADLLPQLGYFDRDFSDPLRFHSLQNEQRFEDQKKRSYFPEKAISCPRVDLDPPQLQKLEDMYPNLARRYHWFSDITWGGEIVLSHMFRLKLAGRILFLETTRYLLTPVKEDFRKVDRLGPAKKSDIIGVFLAGMFLSPFLLVLQPLALLFALLRNVDYRAGREFSKWYSAIEDVSCFNYGAEDSLRRIAMGDSFTHFAQKSEVNFSIQAFNKIVIEEIAQYLEEMGVDTTDLRNKEMTIFNSGVFVQGGDVSAQTLAVGQGASAQTSSHAIPSQPFRKRSQSNQAEVR